jgi:UDP-N-acetylglucosamine:LPS N-acetylglucosamine transferase
MFENICIVFSDTGGGHRSAVQALSAAIREVAADDPNHRIVQITSDNIVEHTNPINKHFVQLYNYLLRHHQPLMKYYYDWLHVLKPSESNLAYGLSKAHLCNWFRQQAPSVVVSMHPMTNHYMARALRDIGVKEHTKLVTVITDPNADLWHSWACPDTDLFIAPNEIVFNKLIEWGMPAERIEVVGMPVHPDFLKEPAVDRPTFLSHLGLSDDALTVCVNAGWAGGGNMLTVLKALRQTERHIQVIFLCGHNKSLYEQAVELTSDLPFAVSVLPFHDRIWDLMKACDLMVTKAGGLTTYQAVASRLPLAIDCITPPMPQERGTVDILVDGGLARRLEEPSDIIKIVQQASVVTDRHRALPVVHNLNNADAIYRMARLILQNSQIAIAAYEPRQPATGDAQPMSGNLGQAKA